MPFFFSCFRFLIALVASWNVGSRPNLQPLPVGQSQCNALPDFSCAGHPGDSIIMPDAALLIRNEWFELQKAL